MANTKYISVSVCYATSASQEVIQLTLPIGSTAQSAISESGILLKHPDIDLSKNDIGIFSKIVKLEQVLNDQDRVEIYRPLLIEPMQARRLRANAKHI